MPRILTEEFRKLAESGKRGGKKLSAAAIAKKKIKTKGGERRPVKLRIPKGIPKKLRAMQKGMVTGVVQANWERREL